MDTPGLHRGYSGEKERVDGEKDAKLTNAPSSRSELLEMTHAATEQDVLSGFLDQFSASPKLRGLIQSVAAPSMTFVVACKWSPGNCIALRLLIQTGALAFICK